MTAPSLAPPLPSRRIKAIFFDLDDTLVQTKDIDVEAYERVVELAHQLVPGLDGQQLIADWRALFRDLPWDPEHKVGRVGEHEAVIASFKAPSVCLRCRLWSSDSISSYVTLAYLHASAPQRPPRANPQPRLGGCGRSAARATPSAVQLSGGGPCWAD